MERIRKIRIKDKDYPEVLRKIAEPPETLYVRGKAPTKEKSFAVVGTRRYSNYGKEVALEITGGLVEAGLTIISGLAPGIDTFAHRAAVEKGKRTIAVLGTGVDRASIYPKINIGLSEKILKNGGCLISEYPPGTHGSKLTFPQRNRIISGLSLGVLVVEARIKSGSLITANWARKQGKKLFAVPGDIHRQNSRGCHYLIKMGAKLIESADDILEDLGLKVTSKEERIVGESKEETLIINSLREGALHIDRIIRLTKLPPATIVSTIAILEIKGKVRNLGGNVYTLKG